MKLRITAARPMADVLDETIDQEVLAARIVAVAFNRLTDQELKCFFMRVAGINGKGQQRALEVSHQRVTFIQKNVMRKLRAGVGRG